MEKLRAERSYNVANVTKQCLFSGEKTRPAKGSSRLLSKKSNLVERISISTQSKRIWNHTKPSVRTYAFTKPGHAVMFCFVGEARGRVNRMSGQSSKRALAKDKWGTEPGGEGTPKMYVSGFSWFPWDWELDIAVTPRGTGIKPSGW